MSKATNARGAPSRRDLIQGVTATASATALPLPIAAAAVDPALLVAAQYQAHEAETRRLIYAWQDHESWLFDHRNWPKLSDAEQAAVPEGALLKTIDAELDAHHEHYRPLISRLRRTSATTREGLLARFDALILFILEEHEEEPAVILKSCLRDLKRLWR